MATQVYGQCYCTKGFFSAKSALGYILDISSREPVVVHLLVALSETQYGTWFRIRTVPTK